MNWWVYVSYRTYRTYIPRIDYTGTTTTLMKIDELEDFRRGWGNQVAFPVTAVEIFEWDF